MHRDIVHVPTPMDPALSAAPRLTRSSMLASKASALAGCAIAIVGSIVLFGWALEIDALKGIYGPITMKANTAVALLLTGIALWAHARGVARTIERRDKLTRLLGMGSAATAGTIGALTLSQHLVGWELGIDQLLFTEPVGAAATASPNRMGPNASTSFTLAGAAILLLFRGTPRAIAAAQRLGIVCVLLPLL